MRQSLLFVTRKQSRGTRILVLGRARRQHLAQGRGIEEAEVDALPGQWMDHVRGITEQRHARSNQGRCRGAPQWDRQSLAAERRGSQHPIAGRIEPQRKLHRRQRHQFFGQHLVGGPDDRAGTVEQRQESQRTGAEETLPGGVLVRPRCRDGRNDGALPVVVSTERKLEQFAHLRVRAVGADDQPRADLAGTGAKLRRTSAHLERLEALAQDTPALRPEARQAGRGERAVFHDVAQIRLRELRSGKYQCFGAVGRSRLVPHAHALVGAQAFLRQPLPGAGIAQQLLAGT